MGKQIVFNYAQTRSGLTANDIPTTIPPEEMMILESGNPNQYYSVESIPYPANGNSHIPGTPASYEEGYFRALNECLKKKPIPGSKYGHEDKQKSSNDVFVVGSRIDSNGDGSGIAHFKILIPATAYNGESNDGLIRDAKLGMLNYSFVSSPVYDIKMVNGIREYHVIGTNGGDRNDVVDVGAMDQTVNVKVENPYPNFHAARMIDPGKFEQDSMRTKLLDKETGLSAIIGRLKGETSMTIQAYRFPKESYTAEEAKKWLKDHDAKPISFEKALRENFDYELTKALALNGQSFRDDIDGEIIQNGRVSYPVLRRLVSHADCENKAEIAEIISIIDKTKNGGKPVELKEALEVVKNSIANGAISILDAGKSIGIEKHVKNSGDDEKIALAENMKKLYGDKPDEAIAAIVAENAANAEATVKNAVIAAVGGEKIGNGDGAIDNPAYQYAFDKVKNKKGKDLSDAIEALKEDAVIKLINSQRADMNSELNRIVPGQKPRVENGYMGHKVIKVGK